MVRKRGALDRIETIMRKKKCFNSLHDTSGSPSSKKDRNLLNDHILNLYKQSSKDKSTLLQNEDLPDSDQATEETEKNHPMENSKPSNKSQKTERKKNSVLSLKHSSLTFNDVGGLDRVLAKVLMHFIHLKHPQLFLKLGVTPVRGLLLHGPPGCGKTHLAQAIAGELGIPYIEVAATELVCGISGESENKIRNIFDEAIKSAPCILFIDEIDAVCPKRETTDRGMEKRIVTQLLKCLDELNEKDISSKMMVIGATKMPDSIDPALRREGRFDREIAIGMPDENDRVKILEVLCKKLQLAPDFDMQWLAHHTPGYVGGDLKGLITAALEACIRRMCQKFIHMGNAKAESGDVVGNSPLLPEYSLGSEPTLESVKLWYKSNLMIPEAELENIYFEQQDFQVAIQDYVPCSKKEGFAIVPDITWDDIGALKDIQKQLQKAILWPVKYRKLYENSHMSSSTKGILLHGPKGCGKTLLAKAVANECSINFLSVKGPELLSMYLGESEKAVRQCFQRARNSAPCVIFFDELDALCPTRSGSNANAAAERVVNQLLTEMDGMEERKQVFVVGATNRLEKIDSAMLRPGRLEKIIYVDIPSPSGRVEILNSLTKSKTRPKISDEVNLEVIGLDARCDNFSGADLAFLVREAFSNAMDDYISSSSSEECVEIKLHNFESAFNVVKPSVTEKERKYFRQGLVT